MTSKETRLQEIKRCLVRAEELGGSSLEPYDLEVRDVRYLVDLIEYSARAMTGYEECLVRKVSSEDCLVWIEEGFEEEQAERKKLLQEEYIATRARI